MDCNIFEMTAEEREAANVRILPNRLIDSVRFLKKDKVLCEALGEHVVTKYTEAKLKEWDEYRTRVTQWELDEYLAKY